MQDCTSKGKSSFDWPSIWYSLVHLDEASPMLQPKLLDSKLLLVVEYRPLAGQVLLPPYVSFLRLSVSSLTLMRADRRRYCCIIERLSTLKWQDLSGFLESFVVLYWCGWFEWHHSKFLIDVVHNKEPNFCASIPRVVAIQVVRQVGSALVRDGIQYVVLTCNHSRWY